jgi:hypothetical protein
VDEFNCEEILMYGRGGIIFNMVGSPIERGHHTGRGKPWAMLKFGRPLTNRQQSLLDRLPGYDSRVTVKKGDVSMFDLAALTAKTDVEFAMFTRGSERLVIRGERFSVNISPFDAAVLNAQGYKWSGHTHVGSNLVKSKGDVDVLMQFTQKRSVIYNAMGKYSTFTV